MAPFSAVKINLAGGETRRFPASSLPLHSYAELRARLATEFPSASSKPEYALSYRDEEGDRVTICSQAEWEGALDCLAGQKVPCFTLSTTSNNLNGAAQHHSFLSSLLGDVLGMEIGTAEEGPRSGGDVNAGLPLFEMFESMRPLAEELEKNLEQQEQGKGGELPNSMNLPFPFPGVPPLFCFQAPASAPPPAAGSPPAKTPHNQPAERAEEGRRDEVFEQEKPDEPEFQMSERAAEERREATVSRGVDEDPAATTFPFAKEFAEVRSIGIAVPDTELRALLLSHGGDVSTVMSLLCTTPR